MNNKTNLNLVVNKTSEYNDDIQINTTIYKLNNLEDKIIKLDAESNYNINIDNPNELSILVELIIEKTGKGKKEPIIKRVIVQKNQTYDIILKNKKRKYTLNIYDENTINIPGYWNQIRNLINEDTNNNSDFIITYNYVSDSNPNKKESVIKIATATYKKYPSKVIKVTIK